MIPVWSDPSEYCTWRFCGFVLDSEMGLLDFPGYFGVLLVMVTSMDVLMCFQADVLLEILRVRVKPGFHYYANAEHKRTQGLAYGKYASNTQDARKLRKPKINYATNASNATKLRKKYASERNAQQNHASQKQKTQRTARKRPCVVKRKNRPRFYFLALTRGDSQ